MLFIRPPAPGTWYLVPGMHFVHAFMCFCCFLQLSLPASLHSVETFCCCNMREDLPSLTAVYQVGVLRGVKLSQKRRLV